MKDPYVYEGTDVLINKRGIRDQAELEKYETAFAAIAGAELRKSDFKIETIYDCLTIHQRLFSEVYDWAGQLRIIDVYKSEPVLDGKSIDYVFASYLKQALKDLQKEFQAVDWEEFDPKEKVEKICYFVSEFWHIHPFREGNTRTAALMLYFLIKKVGLHVSFGFISKNSLYFRNALVLSCLYSSAKPEYLLGIVGDTATVKNEHTGKYETIEGMAVAKYRYTNHTVEKIEAIKKPADWKK